MRRAAIILGAILACGRLARADMITTVDDLVIEGRVQEVTEERVLVLVHHGEDRWGKITIPRDRVRSIEYDLDKRLAELREEDHLGRYEIGEWAYRHGMSDEALAILAEAAGKPDVPAEAYLFMAKIREEKGELSEALSLYGKYALAEPEDDKVKAKIDEIKKLLDKPKAEPAMVAKAPAAPKASPEGLETGSWRYERWGNKADVSVVNDPDGNKLLQVTMDGSGNTDKVALSTRKNVDLAGKSKTTFTIFNKTGRTVQVALAVVTSSGYYESRPVSVKDGWNESLSRSLTGKDYKCKETNWRFETAVKDLDKVQAVMFLIYNGKRKGVFYLDEVSFQ